MNKLKISILVAFVFLSGLVAFSSAGVVLAANKAEGGGSKSTSTKTAPSCGELRTSLINCEAKSDYPVVNLLLDIINFLAVGVGIAVVGGIIWGGMLYASSNGDSTKAKQGVTTIVNSVIGLLLFIFTFALVNFLVPGGLFN
jgi:hypothetical protein